ncbi:hypothetical protein KIN20_026379 [Parelaphostrongylus tenuis]|uniref:Uncharacterized protein n=1 Tax=Parelaphostrongylus tenuis TaxID=148309 RepID=A0AAD5QXZ2_PARTN|nr:hypothetical protein KIN20_026379 [Parelaphostrongylus tenuis]
MGRKRPHDEAEGDQQRFKRVKVEVLSDVNEDTYREPDEEDDSLRRKRKKKAKKRSDEFTEEFQHIEEAGNAKQDFRGYRKKARGMNLSRAKEILDFEEAKRLVLANKKCGLRILREKRHVTLPYHLIGGNVLKSCEFIAKMTVGKYRSKVAGVVVSIGSVRLASLPRVIDDQNVFHVEILVTQAVFRPIVGHTYEARVTHIAEDFISALILDAISINTPIDDKVSAKLKGLTLDVDDIIKVKHYDIAVKRGICQLRGKFMKLLRKGSLKMEIDDASELQVTKASKKQFKFVKSEEEQ